jgi:hypothetical protein
MIKKRFLITSLIVLFQLRGFCQTQYVYYFDNNINIVKKTHAVFKGVGINENGLFELKVFDMKNKKILLLEHFTDSSLQISNGLFVTYYNNSGKELEGNFLMGKQNGLWIKRNQAGNIIDSSLFDNGERIMQTTFSYYPNGKLFILNIDSIKAGKKNIVYFNEIGNIVTPETTKNTNDIDKIFIRTEVEAAFPGDKQAWMQYITTIIQKHIDQLTRRQEFGTCMLRFIVKKDGSVSDIEATTMKGTKLAEIAIDAIRNGPKWIPAQQNGRSVNAYKIVPIKLQDPNAL